MEQSKQKLPKKFISSGNLITKSGLKGYEPARRDKSEIGEAEDNNICIVDISGNESPKKKNSINDFELMYVLGRGSYAKVVKAKNIFTDKYYALKIIDKKFLAKVNIYLN